MPKVITFKLAIVYNYIQQGGYATLANSLQAYGKSRPAISNNGKLEAWPPIGRERERKDDSSCLRYMTEASRQDQRLVHQEKMDWNGKIIVALARRRMKGRRSAGRSQEEKAANGSIVEYGSTDRRAEKDRGTVTTEKDGTSKDREREEGTGYCSERSEERRRSRGRSASGGNGPHGHNGL